MYLLHDLAITVGDLFQTNFLKCLINFKMCFHTKKWCLHSEKRGATVRLSMVAPPPCQTPSISSPPRPTTTHIYLIKVLWCNFLTSFQQIMFYLKKILQICLAVAFTFHGKYLTDVCQNRGCKIAPEDSVCDLVWKII